MPDPVSITGIGVVSAFGETREGFRDALLAGRTGVAPFEEFATAGCRSVLTAHVAGFDKARWIPPMKLRRMDDTGPFALVSVLQAMEDARYSIPPEGDDRAGVVLGTYSAGGQATNDYLAAFFRGGPTGVPALMFNSTVANAATGLCGLELKLRGPNVTISQKEASGLAAIATAVDAIRTGRAGAVAAGGTDAIYDIFFKAHDTFHVMNASSAPGPATAPFDRCRGGFVMGEGGFALWLEGADAWRERGARCYGQVLGIGASSTAVPLNAWPSTTAPLVRTMEMALDEAGLSPAEVDVVYASANASGLDEVEAAALTELFGREQNRQPVVTSAKGGLGEFGASGAAACAAALLCGQARSVPPIAGLARPDSSASHLRLATQMLPAPGPHVLVNSFASGGALFSVVLRVFPPSGP